MTDFVNPGRFVRTKYYATATGAVCKHGFLMCYYTWATPPLVTCLCCGVFDYKVNRDGICPDCAVEDVRLADEEVKRKIIEHES